MSVRHEEQWILDVTQFQRPETQILLKEMCIGIFDAVPTSALRKEPSGHKVHNVPAANDSFPKCFKCALAGWIVMLIEPREAPGPLQRTVDWVHEAMTILRTVRKEHMVR